MTLGEAIANELHKVRDLLDKNEWQLVELLMELREYRSRQRCPKHPKGEQCALPQGHEGGCKWGRGD